jgi:hypothetical protein
MPSLRHVTPENNRLPIVYEAGWIPGTVWKDVENLAPMGIQYPHRPASSESLYRLSYPSPHLYYNGIKFSHSIRCKPWYNETIVFFFCYVFKFLYRKAGRLEVTGLWRVRRSAVWGNADRRSKAIIWPVCWTVLIWLVRQLCGMEPAREILRGDATLLQRRVTCSFSSYREATPVRGRK